MAVGNFQTYEETHMSSLAHLGNLSIDNIGIRMDAQGRYCLNDLHKASGGEQKNQPRYWLENKQTQELVQVLTDSGIPLSPENEPINVIRGGSNQGTYVVKELVYSYAMWISPAFNLKVIRTFDRIISYKNNLGHASEQCVAMAHAFGFIGNQALLSADKAVRRLTGYSPLELMGSTHLTSSIDQVTYTPTQIGLLLTPKQSAHKINIKLQELGYQVKRFDSWVPTERGKAHSEVLDTGKQHSDGTPVKQLKWKGSILEFLAK